MHCCAGPDLVSELSVITPHCARMELAYAKKGVPYLEPRVVDLNPGGEHKEPVVSFHMASLLERALQTDPEFRKTILAKSDDWKLGERYQQEATVLEDFVDGSVARHHPHLLRPATEDESDDVRIALFTNGDDVEVNSCPPRAPPFPPAPPPLCTPPPASSAHCTALPPMRRIQLPRQT